MPDILHDFPIKASPERVFDAISQPSGLDRWWTKRASGEARPGAVYELWFGPRYDWRARVTRCVPKAQFELQMTRSDADWMGTRVGFDLAPSAAGTAVRFYHRGWPVESEHYRVSCFCWAMYLRILRRFLENGETVPYDERLDV